MAASGWLQSLGSPGWSDRYDLQGGYGTERCWAPVKRFSGIHRQDEPYSPLKAVESLLLTGAHVPNKRRVELPVLNCQALESLGYIF